MAKNLKQFREKAATKGPSVKLKEIIPPADNTVATQRFIKKHVVAHHEDPAGNGDDVYNASNIKPVKRSPDHGYDPCVDEMVYESYIVESEAILDRAKKAAHDYSGEVVLTNPEKTKQWALASHDESGSHWYPHHHDPKINDMSPDPDRSYKRFPHRELGKMLDSGHTLHILHHEEPEEDDEGGITINSKSFETGAMLPLNANGNVAKGANPQAVERHPRSLIYVPTRKTRKRTDESYVTEVLDIKNMTVKQVIDDFVKSKDKRFAGKNRKERIKMALGAYYGEHPRKRTTKKETGTSVNEMRSVPKSRGPADDNNYWGNQTSPSVLERARIAAERASTKEKAKQPPPVNPFAGNFQGLLKHQGSQKVADLTSKIKAQKEAARAESKGKGFVGTILRTLGLNQESEQVLTNLYNTLNEENREKMVKLLESEEGFIKLIEFAVEKGID